MITDGGSPFALLAFLGLVLGSLVTGVLIAVALVRGQRNQARFWSRCALAGGAAYFFSLLVVSILSHARSLTRATEKYFCEVDCHHAAAVLGVHTIKTIGTRTASGVFYVVTVQTRFDEHTTRAGRGNGLLYANPRRVIVTDAAGHAYPLSPAGQEEALRRPLRPGERYSTDLVFDLPADVREPRLTIIGSDPVSRFMIGHENSFFHAKTSFLLDL